MKYQLASILALIIYCMPIYSQNKIGGDIGTALFLGRVPEKTKINTLSDNLITILYYKVQPENSLKVGYINRKGKIHIPQMYNMGSDFYGDKANIVKDSIFGFMNKKGEETLFPQYDKTFFYYQDTGIAKKNGKYGLIDIKGKPLTDFTYNMINFFGFHFFRGQTKNKVTQILDNKGNVVFNKEAPIFDIESHHFNSDSSIVYEETIKNRKLKGLVSLGGKVILKPSYEEINEIGDKGLFIVMKDKKWGIINTSGDEIIPMIYEKIGNPHTSDLIPVKKVSKWGYINLKNEQKIPYLYDQAYAFLEGVAFVKQGEYYGCIDKKNRIKIKIDLEKTNFPFFTSDLAVFKKENKYGFINKKGAIKIPAIYDLVYPFFKGKAYVELNGKAGYINKRGKEVIPIKYKQLWFESEEIIRFAE